MHQSEASCIFLPGRSLESGVDLLRPVQGVEFLAADAIGFACSGLAIPTDIPALKELEEWFDSQKEIRAALCRTVELPELAPIYAGGSRRA